MRFFLDKTETWTQYYIRKRKRIFTFAEVTARKNTLLVLRGNVLDVGGWFDLHPGGKEVLLEYGGQDATKVFEEVFHSPEAEKLASKLVIGRLRDAHPEVLGNSETPKKKQHGSYDVRPLFGILPVFIVLVLWYIQAGP